MPIAEFPAVISPESILRDGTGDFSARRATDGSHDGQIYQNANSNTAISAHHATGKTHTGQLPPNLSEQLTISPRHATRKSHTGRILPGPGTRPTTTRPPSDHTIAPRTDTTEFRRPLNAISTPCDRKVAQQTDTSRIQHQAGGICPPCAHAAAPRADNRLQATDRQPPASTRNRPRRQQKTTSKQQQWASGAPSSPRTPIITSPDGCRRPSIRHPSSFFLSSLPVRPAQAPDRGRQSNHPHPQCPRTGAPSSPEPQASSRTPKRGSWPPAAQSGIPRRRVIRRA